MNKVGEIQAAADQVSLSVTFPYISLLVLRM